MRLECDNVGEVIFENAFTFVAGRMRELARDTTKRMNKTGFGGLNEKQVVVSHFIGSKFQDTKLVILCLEICRTIRLLRHDSV